MQVANDASISARIETAFRTASQSTGTSFDYLLKTAVRESSLDPTAKARTSSATGLFQFIESTWLELVKETGPSLGMHKHANAITKTDSGKYIVVDRQQRAEILALRENPEVASVLAGVFTEKNARYLGAKLGRQPSDGELYIAHFLGANGASRLIGHAESHPDKSAVQAFPRQAAANKSIFFERNGAERSVSQVYAHLVQKHGTGTSATGSAPEPGMDIPQTLTAFSETRETDLWARFNNAFRAVETSSPFQSMFHTHPARSLDPLGTSSLTSFVDQEAFFDKAPRPRAKSEIAGQFFAALQETPKSKPLDLTGFLSYRRPQEQRELLPPA